MSQWYGYKHVDGSIHAKRYFDNKDITEAHESGFVEQVINPFFADSRDEAIEVITKRLE